MKSTYWQHALALILSTLLTFTRAQQVTSIVTVPPTSTVTLTASTTTATNVIAAPTTPPSPQYTNSLTLKTTVLNSTNLYRFEHNASYLQWNDSLASYAQSYADKCIWAHSHGAPGENLARGYPTVEQAVEAWGNERDLYDFAGDQTGFSEETGHFTQLVWKSTQTVGCGATNCDGKNDLQGWMFVCEYWPAGNVEGVGADKNLYFVENVQAQINSPEDFNTFSATVGATGVGTSWATVTAMPSPTGDSGAVGRRPALWGSLFMLPAFLYIF